MDALFKLTLAVMVAGTMVFLHVLAAGTRRAKDDLPEVDENGQIVVEATEVHEAGK